MRLESTRTQWLLVLGFIVVAALLFVHTRVGEPSPGADISFVVSLTPEDAVRLDCASERSFGDVRCAFAPNGEPQKAGSPLHPYVAVGGEVILASGIFESPDTAAWYAEAVRRGKKETRIPIECEGTVIGRVSGAKVRWALNAPFVPTEKPPWAIQVSRCTPKPPPPPRLRRDQMKL